MDRVINDTDLKTVNVFTAAFGVICLVGATATVICAHLQGLL